MKLQTLVLLASSVAAWSPSGGYAPGQIDCPSGSFVRSANNISESEAEWIEERHKVTDTNLKLFLEGAGLENFNAELFLSNTTDGRSLSIGIAFSGGGYRAMLSGAGQIAALDNRTTNASNSGLGGLLQSATYLSGLSGGNWLVGSVVLNNWTSVEDILNDGSIWDLEHSIVNYGGWNPIKAYNYYDGIWDDLSDKKDAGFELSLTDTWGRALSHQFFPELINFGNSLLWSQIRDLDAFTSHEMPFPIVVANGRTPGTFILSGNSTVFEFNAYEMGSWDPSLYSFTDVKYLGTQVKNGKPVNGTCIGGFDNAGFVMGTSSSLFNQFVLQINTTSLSSTLKSIITSMLDSVSHDEDDIAVYKPNPFKSAEGAFVQTIVNNDTLYLVDGGEDLQNIPLYPLIQKERNIDVIFAYDNSADTNESWPNGTAMIASYERQFLSQGNGTIFPYVPSSATFRNLNLTAKPAFFGCDASNLTSLLPDGADEKEVYDSPLIVYTANRPFTYYSNTSTFKLSYDESEKRGMIKNGFEVASRLNHSLDSDWKACVACAIIRREQERQGVEQSDQCKRCFQEYCWTGGINNDTPGINFTTTGTTNGDQDNGNRTVSAGFSLIRAAGGYEVVKVFGYALVVIIACTISL
ncbi:CIC11C00000003222 [Sungouiella intermedia]|uniref:Lysophospholipase n=1 Tax=Sungouiella intermedia TaxID=45354 RepID=A0A1L0D8P2_9ASCO|nr:CIC11C00000004917 [[Candida] intermedia]SGZ52177.1 CIC11C00000003222 [[Candida] intermedia]